MMITTTKITTNDNDDGKFDYNKQINADSKDKNNHDKDGIDEDNDDAKTTMTGRW